MSLLNIVIHKSLIKYWSERLITYLWIKFKLFRHFAESITLNKCQINHIEVFREQFKIDNPHLIFSRQITCKHLRAEQKKLVNFSSHFSKNYPADNFCPRKIDMDLKPNERINFYEKQLINLI